MKRRSRTKNKPSHQTHPTNPNPSVPCEPPPVVWTDATLMVNRPHVDSPNWLFFEQYTDANKQALRRLIRRIPQAISITTSLGTGGFGTVCMTSQPHVVAKLFLMEPEDEDDPRLYYGRELLFYHHVTTLLRKLRGTTPKRTNHPMSDFLHHRVRILMPLAAWQAEFQYNRDVLETIFPHAYPNMVLFMEKGDFSLMELLEKFDTVQDKYGLTSAEREEILHRCMDELVPTFQFLDFANVIHADVRSTNIIFKKEADRRYHPYLIDFGFAGFSYGPPETLFRSWYHCHPCDAIRGLNDPRALTKSTRCPYPYPFAVLGDVQSLGLLALEIALELEGIPPQYIGSDLTNHPHMKYLVGQYLLASFQDVESCIEEAWQRYEGDQDLRERLNGLQDPFPLIHDRWEGEELGKRVKACIQMCFESDLGRQAGRYHHPTVTRWILALFTPYVHRFALWTWYTSTVDPHQQLEYVHQYRCSHPTLPCPSSAPHSQETSRRSRRKSKCQRSNTKKNQTNPTNQELPSANEPCSVCTFLGRSASRHATNEWETKHLTGRELERKYRQSRAWWPSFFKQSRSFLLSREATYDDQGMLCDPEEIAHALIACYGRSDVHDDRLPETAFVSEKELFHVISLRDFHLFHETIDAAMKKHA